MKTYAMRMLLTILLTGICALSHAQRATRINYNEPNPHPPKYAQPFLRTLPSSLDETGYSFIYVNEGSYLRGMVRSKLSPENGIQAQITEVTVPGFLIASTEVSNGQYLEFLEEMTLKNGEGWKRAHLPDTSLWKEFDPHEPRIAYDQLFSPDMTGHPVIGISLHQARDYCAWLTEKASKLLSQDPKWSQKYKLERVRLPTEIEWEYAACGSKATRESDMGNISPFPWYGHHIYADAISMGVQYLANFGEIIDQNGFKIKEYVDDDYYLTNPVREKENNHLGIFNMGGNAAEWVEKDLSYYDGSPLPNSPEQGIIKGASFVDPPMYLQADMHRYLDASETMLGLGFRVVLQVTQK